MNSLTSATEAPLTARPARASEKEVVALRGYNPVLPLQNVYILCNTTDSNAEEKMARACG